MVDSSNRPPMNDDDQEMMDAIMAAFGPDAIQSLEERDLETGEGAESLESIVRQIDAQFTDTASDSTTDLTTDNTGRVERYIVVEIGGAKFGIPMCNILEVQRVPHVTYLPRVPNWVHGVVNIRGTIMSVVDLQTILGMPPSDGPSTANRLIVVQSLLDDIDAGLIVDRVLGIRSVAEVRIESPTGPVSEQITAYLQGVYVTDSDVVCLLDIEKLLLSDVFRQFETA